MARHKAPTHVTVASTHQSTPLHEAVERYWKLALLLAAVVTVGILGLVLARERGSERERESWQRLEEDVSFGFGVTPPEPAVLAGLTAELGDAPAAPWSKAIEVGQWLREEDPEAARRALAELREQWPDHPLVQLPLYPERDGERRTLGERVEARTGALSEWREQHSWLFQNPPLPEDAPRARIETTAGPIVVGFWADRAPLHVENFLELAREGFYEGTKFHRVVKGFMIQGGDPNTREGDPETWGQGGPEHGLEPEDSGLRHFAFVLASAKTPGAAEESGSQFYITTAPAHHLDGEHTVFGQVVEGEDVVRAIEEAPVEGERPQEPVEITRVEVL